MAGISVWWVIGAFMAGVLFGWLGCSLATVSQMEERAMTRGDHGQAEEL